MFFVLFSFFMIMSYSIFCMNDHVENTHCFQKNLNYVSKIVNKDTGVVSAIAYNKSNQLVQSRKTYFSKNMQDYDDFKQRLDFIINQKSVIFRHEQCNNSKGRKVDFKQDASGILTIAIVKDQYNKISTVYPLLRYISADELSYKQDTDKIYIATKYDDKNNEYTDVVASVKTIKDVSRKGVFLGLVTDKKGNVTSYLVDISQEFPFLFYDQVVKRGSIGVETDWINKR